MIRKPWTAASVLIAARAAKEHRERESARIRERLARGQARRAPAARLPVRQNIRIWAAGLATAPDRQRAH